jgi:succinyl-diaminopimelate desuccinylase
MVISLNEKNKDKYSHMIMTRSDEGEKAMSFHAGNGELVVEPEQAVVFLQQLIRLNSVNPPGNEEQVAHFIATHFANVPGCKVRLVSIASGRSNVEIVFGSKQKTLPALLFTGHLDTVSPGELSNWTHDPFAADMVDEKIYGRGAADMKGGVAAIVLALEALARSSTELACDVIFLGTVGEEVDQAGACVFLNEGKMEGVGAVIVGEPTNGDLGPAHKGALYIRLSTYGRTAHGSTPEQGVNAVKHMITLVDHIEKHVDLVAPAHALLKPPTLTLTTLSGGIQTNVIPDRAQATFDIRTVPGLDHDFVIRQVKQGIAELTQRLPGFRAEMEILNNRPPVSTPTESPLMGLAQQVYRDILGRQPIIRAPNFYTDASVLSIPRQIPTLIYGPGDDRLAHQPDEFIDVSAYLSSIYFYYHLAKRYGQIGQTG